MAIHYSPAQRGFFDPAVHQLPEDAVPVTPARHARLIEQQAQGGEIVPDADGRPVIRKQHAADMRAALVRAVKSEAARRIAQISPAWRQLNDLRSPTEEGARRFALVDAVRSASGLIEEQVHETLAAELASFPVRDNPLWPETDS